jgi:tetratricopeptide (TPR) repeat protein
MTTLAWIYQHLGRLEQAVHLRREGLALAQLSGDRWAQVNGAACLAYSLFWQGKFEEVQRWADHSLALCLEVGQRGQEGFVRLAVCCAHLMTGRYARARQQAEPARAMAREAGNAGVEATVIWALGYLALAEHDYAGARSHFAESRRLYEAVQDNYLGLTLSGPGYVACAEGQCAQARPYFVEALQFALALHDYITLNMTLPGVALWLSLTGDRVRAVEVWELALCLPMVAHSQWYADFVGQRLETVALALAPAEREAAQARGRALDLWGTAAALADDLRPHAVTPAAMQSALAPRLS